MKKKSYENDIVITSLAILSILEILVWNNVGAGAIFIILAVLFYITKGEE